MDDKITYDMIEDLKKAIVAIDDETLCEDFFKDLFTVTETEQFAQRLRAAKLLIEGNTYSQIISKTEISSATLSRVNNCVRHGSGAYKKIIGKIEDK